MKAVRSVRISATFQPGEGRRVTSEAGSLWRRPTFWFAAATSVLYLVLAVRFVLRMLSVPDLNASAKTYLWGWLAMTIVLYLLCVALAMSQRKRPEAPVPVLGAALFGSFVASSSTDRD